MRNKINIEENANLLDTQQLITLEEDKTNEGETETPGVTTN